jgi:hypothetical protein
LIITISQDGHASSGLSDDSSKDTSVPYFPESVNIALFFAKGI